MRKPRRAIRAREDVDVVLPKVMRRLGQAVQQWAARRRRPALWVLAVVAVLFAVVFLYVRPMGRVSEAGLDPERRLKAEHDIRTTLVQAVGGAIVLVGTWRTLHINREGQITERFTRAIEHLGHSDDELDIRLGGIYALERIARDSKSDRGPIVEVLTAFLREHARWNPGSGGAPSATDDVAHRRGSNQMPRVRADVQAVATVLGRNDWSRRHPYDLHGVDLRRASLDGAHLQGADLGGARLEWARLRDAHLEGAFLAAAHLEGANLDGAHLEHANFVGARLERASFRGANLARAGFFSAHLQHADLVDAHMERANVRYAHLEGANLTDAHLKGVIGLQHAHRDGIIGLARKPAQTEPRTASEREPG